MFAPTIHVYLHLKLIYYAQQKYQTIIPRGMLSHYNTMGSVQAFKSSPLITLFLSYLGNI